MTIRRPDPRSLGAGDVQPDDPLASAIWIRPAARADQPAVRELVERVLGEFGLALDPDDTDADLDDIELAYRVRGGEFWVVEDGHGRIVGTCGMWVFPGDEGRGELRKMYLDDSLRGRGLGRRLLDTALTHARDAGLTRVELETNAAMTAAIGLYRSAGFAEIEADTCSRCDRRFALELA